MRIYLAGGGTLGKQETLHEMFFYLSGGAHWGSRNEMLFYHAGKEYTVQESMKSYFAGTDYTDNTRVENELKFYFADRAAVKDEKVFEQGCRNRLLSFADVETCKGAFQFWLDKTLPGKSVFIDSGAFSAKSRGAEIDIHVYCSWLKQHLDAVAVYASLDVIGDWQATQHNLEVMENEGLHPIPTFHYGSPKEELLRLNERYDYIALGGLVPLTRSAPTMKRWLDFCFGNITPGKKIHLFGITTQWVLERYPAYSCDSTSAIAGGGMGRVIYFDGKKLSGENHTLIRDPKHMGLVDKFEREGSAHLARRLHNIREMLKFERYVTELWTKRGVTWNS